MAHPYFFFSFSASSLGVLKPIDMSLVMWFPARARTEVYLMLPSEKITRSVVPPPISTRATPISVSSLARTASPEPSCSRTRSFTLSPARLAHRMMFCAEVTAPVTMWTFPSSLTPSIPTGFLIPSWSSTMNSWGRT